MLCASGRPGSSLSGRQAHGLAQGGGGLGVTARAFQQVAGLVRRLRLPRVERAGPGESRQGLVRPARPAQGQAVVQMIGRQTRPGGHRPGEIGLGANGVSLQQRGLPEQVEREGLRGVLEQEAFAQPHGLGGPPGTLVFDGLFEERGHPVKVETATAGPSVKSIQAGFREAAKKDPGGSRGPIHRAPQ
jgi:hypothetical protein